MLIELRGLTKSYGAVQALRGVSAGIDGRIIGLLGPNGAGKSTLLKSMLGLIDFSGDATVLGLSSRAESFAIRDRVGYMPEMDSYLTGMTAVEVCTYAAQLSGLPRSEAMQRAHAALYHAGLEDKRYLKVEGYSTGMKQRVKLAQALVHDPDLLFLDEPTNGLDPRGRDEMLALIEELPGRRECAIVLSTHLLPDVERVCDQVVIMHRGELRYSGTVDDLRAGSSHDARVFEVEVKAGADRLAAALGEAGCKVETKSALHLIVSLADGEGATQVLRAARASGVQVRRLEVRRLSLEAAFLRELGAAGGAA